MVNIEDKYNCCGCTACASICAHDAITMTPDSLGFLYPKVNPGHISSDFHKTNN